MVRTELMVMLFVFCVVPLGLGQETSVQDSAKLASLRQRAEHGDAKAQSELGLAYEYGSGAAQRDYGEAVRWYRKAAEQGDSLARHQLGRIYAEGIVVKRDYAEAARWYSCPKPSEQSLASCKEISYDDLPDGVSDLLGRLKCEVSPGDNYDYGSAVDLNGDGSLEYQFCCHTFPHGPCEALLIGRVGTQWKALTSFRGYTGACTGFLILENQREGFHDLCLPDVCSSKTMARTKTCVPTILRFNRGQYQEVEFTPAKQGK